MHLALERFFFCALLANIQQDLQSIVTLQKITLSRFPKKVLFHRPRKKHPVDWDSPWKPSSAISDMKINNCSKKFLKERTIEEELQETFPLAAIFVYSLARGKKTEH